MDKEKNQNLLLNRHVMTNAAPFTLESNARGVIWSGRRGVKGRATLRVGVVVVVLHNTASTISPQHSPILCLCLHQQKTQWIGNQLTEKSPLP